MYHKILAPFTLNTAHNPKVNKAKVKVRFDYDIKFTE